jgi:hypothetical protein
VILWAWRWSAAWGWRWELQREVSSAEAERWRAVFQKDEPDIVFAVASKKPTKPPEGFDPDMRNKWKPARREFTMGTAAHNPLDLEEAASRWLYHRLPLPAFRRVMLTNRLAPEDARRPYVWFSATPEADAGANEVTLVFARAALADQLIDLNRSGWRSRDPHKPVRFKPEWIDRALVSDDRLVPGVQAMMPDVRIGPLDHEARTVIQDHIAEGWVRPSTDDEREDIELAAAELGLRPGALVDLVGRSPIEPLAPDVWATLEGTESWEATSLERARELAAVYGKDIERILRGMLNDERMPAPIVLERDDGVVVLISGNARLCAARALGIRPWVVFVRLDFEDPPTSEDGPAHAHPAIVKGKRADIGPPNFFRKEPHAPNSRSIAKVDPSGYHGQHTPPGASVRLPGEARRNGS